ncbi:MAG: ABC transporter permease [SAR202 cluster bacterium]|nr:ABC transporter permease [SAR202 cluster bacterium]
MTQLFISNLKIMYRNRQTAFWALFFPLLLVTVFGLFNMNEYSKSKIGILDLAQSESSSRLINELNKVQGWNLFIEDEPNTLQNKLESGALEYAIYIPKDFSNTEPFINIQYASANDVGHQVIAATTRDTIQRLINPNYSVTTIENSINKEPANYFDNVLLGIIGLAITVNSVISVTIQLSTYRNQKILKRLLATPLPIWKFFFCEILAHLVLVLVQTTIILAVGSFVFDANIYGNLLYIYMIVVIGTIVFINIGFILSAWANSPAAGSGLGNAVIFPMIFLSGTFFPAEYLPWPLPLLSAIMPLTPMLNGLREVALSQMSLVDIWPSLLILLVWIILSGVIANRVFKFN